MNISAIIIDDESHNIENLQLIITKYCSDITIKATAANAIDGVSIIQQYQPDLVFLDIQMPDQSGFDLLSKLSSITFEIIFITAYDKYGIQAIKFSALDYLLKPINVREFGLAVEKARLRIQEKQRNSNLENLLSYIKAGNRDPKIALPTQKETLYVKISDIIRCEAVNNYTTFCLKNREQILVCKTLKEFSDLLKPQGFARTHQSHLVNIKYVKSYLKEDGGTLLLDNQDKIPISRQNRESIKIVLNQML
ncbi:LytR/AlgR family response regulator transcription factor [Pedobacter sp. KACC 23697]|uniref:LytTR family DNA-binding domain-containing protein n=1 Tax=Pedobacter sp. KACC 23697 TaxID=3149230 RepID=A0AAU7K519_9SPHI